MEYDEDKILATYIWQFFGRHLSRAEVRVFCEVQARDCEAAGMDQKARIIRVTQKLSGDPEVDAAIAEGLEKFRGRVVRRILRENAAEIFINRCGRCGKIVATPKAHQCLWCGFDWHKREEVRA